MGEAPLPLSRIASSGELARVMLALKAILADLDSVPVLVFDEVDANVGGEIGSVVGERMAAIAQFVLIALAFATLVHAYVTSDFSVANVAENSHSDKPMLYKVTGVWGNHEGSMVLWLSLIHI